MNQRQHKISFCITCMDRLEHLQKTLETNLLDNQDYENLEFVILDYNSKQDIKSFILSKFSALIATGRIVYYRTPAPQYFNRSHSRNLSFKLAIGDILCNLDADNYTGPGFASFINDKFHKNANACLSAIRSVKKKSAIGRLCIKRKDFLNVGGFDEQMICYGFEDYDLINRLIMNGCKNIIIDNFKYLKTVGHSRLDRLKNEYYFKNILSVFSQQRMDSSTELIFLFKDSTYSRGIILNNRTYQYTGNLSPLQSIQRKHTHSILEENWRQGNWILKSEVIELYDGSNTSVFFQLSKGGARLEMEGNNQIIFNLVNDFDARNILIMRLSQITNRILMYKNILEKQVIKNPNGFGVDIVFKNSDIENAISVS